jgi:hypothetical protein
MTCVDKDTNYIVCPDRTCKLFWEKDCYIPCEFDCPKKTELKKVIRCTCGELIILSGNHSPLQRVDHKHSDNAVVSLFYRMSGKYKIVYQTEEIP